MEEKEITMKKSELEKVIDTKSQERIDVLKAEWEKKSAQEKLDMAKAQDEAIEKAIKKSETERKSIEDTGHLLDGSLPDRKTALKVTLEKSKRWGSELSDFDKDFQNKSDKLALMAHIYKGDVADKGEGAIVNTNCFKEYMKLVKNMHKSYDEGSGTGAEWLPSTMSNRLIDLMEVDNDFTIANLFERIPMTSKTLSIPRATAHNVAYKGAIDTTPGGAGAGSTTDNTDFSVEKIIAWTATAYEQDEDQIFALLPYIERVLVSRLAKGTSNAIINGSSAGTMDDGLTATVDVRLAWDGLRQICQTNSYTKSVAGVWTTAKMRAFVNEIDLAFSEDFSDLAFIVGKDTRNQYRGLTEVTTVDKIGQNMATIIHGVLKQIDGIDIIPTSLVLDAVNASGVVNPTAANNTKGQALCVAKSAFALGVKRSVMLESDKDIKKQNIDIVASTRMDFQSLIKASSQQAVVQAINITTV